MLISNCFTAGGYHSPASGADERIAKVGDLENKFKKFFKRIVRKNQVFELTVGPFNPYLYHTANTKQVPGALRIRFA
jgi:hypothetical protein